MCDKEKLSNLDETEAETESGELEPPSEFICTLTMEIMDDPLMSKYGHNYERAAILEWLTSGHDTCPMTRQPMRLSDLISNHRLRGRIHEWKLENFDNVAPFLAESATVVPQYFGIIDVNTQESFDLRYSDEPTSNVSQIGRGSSRRRRSSMQDAITSLHSIQSSTRRSRRGMSTRFLKHFLPRRAISSQAS